MNQKYFSGLNGLRFLAAFLVIFHHIAQYRNWLGLPNSWGNSAIDAMGHMPVSFFFVLSGFLITYLLMHEYDQTGTISVRFFYFKRVIRIWPLYFLIVLLALLITQSYAGSLFGVKNDPSAIKVILPLIAIFPNLLRVTFPNLVGGNQLWSIGVEEQFYLFWPILILLFRKRLITFLWVFIVAKLTIHIAILGLLDFTHAGALTQLEKLYHLFSVEQMAIGALGAYAYYYFKQTHWFQSAKNPLVLPLTLGIIVWLSQYPMGFIQTYLEAVIFLMIILHVIQNQWINSILENKHISYLGQISFGIYMWHTIAIVIVMLLMNLFRVDLPMISASLICVVTILLAHVSYHVFEKPFLKLRHFGAPKTQPA